MENMEDRLVQVKLSTINAVLQFLGKIAYDSSAPLISAIMTDVNMNDKLVEDAKDPEVDPAPLSE